mgnify:FL=1
MGARIAPVTPNNITSYNSAIDYDQLAQMFFILQGMPIKHSKARADQTVCKIAQDRLIRLGGRLYQLYTYLDQQIAIAQSMNASILIVQKLAQHAKSN